MGHFKARRAPQSKALEPEPGLARGPHEPGLGSCPHYLKGQQTNCTNFLPQRGWPGEQLLWSSAPSFLGDRFTPTTASYPSGRYPRICNARVGAHMESETRETILGINNCTRFCENDPPFVQTLPDLPLPYRWQKKNVSLLLLIYTVCYFDNQTSRVNRL